MKAILTTFIFTFFILLGGCSSFSLPVQKHLIDIPAITQIKKNLGAESITDKRFNCIKKLVQMGVSQKRIAELCNSVYGSVDE